MKISAFILPITLVFGSLSSSGHAWAIDKMLAADPYQASTPKPGATSYSIDIRIINHGVTDIPAGEIKKLVHAVDVIYSQCDGVDFHVNVLGMEQAPYTTEQDDFFSDATTVGDGYARFFLQFPNKAATRRIDVHLFDFLDSSMRERAKGGDYSEVVRGDNFSALLMDNLWKDGRSPQFRNGKLSDIGGNTIRLGMDTLNGTEGILTHIGRSNSLGKRVPVKAWREYHWSTLAHEMGHILMDPQDGIGKYIDHYCPGTGQTCGLDNVMSPGGYDDTVYLNTPEMDSVIGYSPLPALEKEQCALLKNHPLVKRTLQAQTGL